MMRINLLPEQYRPEPAVNPVRLSIFIVGAVLIFIAGIWTIIQSSKLQSEKQMLATVMQQIDSYQSTIREIESYEAKLKVLKQRLSEINKIKSAYLQYPFVLKKLAGALTEDMWLNSVNMPPLGTITINGKSLLFTNISGLVKNLNETPGLSDVKLSNVSAEDTGEENNLTKTFSFSLKLKTGGGE
jgi:Tfp pilus assembly protein PilN